MAINSHYCGYCNEYSLLGCPEYPISDNTIRTAKIRIGGDVCGTKQTTLTSFLCTRCASMLEVLPPKKRKTSPSSLQFDEITKSYRRMKGDVNEESPLFL